MTSARSTFSRKSRGVSLAEESWLNLRDLKHVAGVHFWTVIFCIKIVVRRNIISDSLRDLLNGFFCSYFVCGSIVCSLWKLIERGDYWSAIFFEKRILASSANFRMTLVQGDFQLFYVISHFNFIICHRVRVHLSTVFGHSLLFLFYYLFPSWHWLGHILYFSFLQTLCLFYLNFGRKNLGKLPRIIFQIPFEHRWNKSLFLWNHRILLRRSLNLERVILFTLCCTLNSPEHHIYTRFLNCLREICFIDTCDLLSPNFSNSFKIIRSQIFFIFFEALFIFVILLNRLSLLRLSLKDSRHDFSFRCLIFISFRVILIIHNVRILGQDHLIVTLGNIIILGLN